MWLSVKIGKGEHIILVGGPSLNQWEQYKEYPHDHWWANFVHAARLETENLKTEGINDITWLVYKPGYVARGKQENKNLIEDINSVKEKFKIKLTFFNTGREVIDYINAQPVNSITGLEYFGHSNKSCFMFDYSSVVDSSSKAWLHEEELNQLNRKVFARNCFIKSWGCHTGESMSQKWHKALGNYMVGANGKTTYLEEELPIIETIGGGWTK